MTAHRIAHIDISDLQPATPSRAYPAKGVRGQPVDVTAQVLKDGHDLLAGRLRWRPVGGRWASEALAEQSVGRWGASFVPTEIGAHEARVEVWTDRFATWRRDLAARAQAGQDLAPHFLRGAELLRELAPGPPLARPSDAVRGAGGEGGEGVGPGVGATNLGRVGPGGVGPGGVAGTGVGAGVDGAAVGPGGVDVAGVGAGGAGAGPGSDLDVGARLVEAADALERTACRDEVRLAVALDPALAVWASGIVGPWDHTRSAKLYIWVDRERAAASAWYELFPRSFGGFAGVTAELPRLADLGFDVLYLPPVHPIGRTFRKGRNNSLVAGPDDVGSPWAIGAAEGGHTAIHPDLGSEADLAALVEAARAQGIEVALDYALQCSPDHPWVAAHPEWFHHLPDGSIQYAENPPKKYQDIYPLNFWPPKERDRKALWEACWEIVEHWTALGITIFRVDNPHTKPLAFWAWLCARLRDRHPEVVLLAEAFTEPAMMAKLAEVGFGQSYTYFTWRGSRAELTDYVTELAGEPLVNYFRPNFWPNTPDILEGVLREGPLSAFALRLVQAATLVPNYGIYSGYELGENRPASADNTEYLDSEKYQLVRRDFSAEPNLGPLLRRLNGARRRHPALRQLRGTTFHGSSNEAFLVYSKATADRSDVVLCVVNLDPWAAQEATLDLDLSVLGLVDEGPFEVVDELTDAAYRWQGRHPWARLDPAHQPAHVFALRRL